MHAVAGEFFGWHIVAHLAGARRGGYQVFDEAEELLLCCGEVFAAVHGDGEFGAVGPLVDEDRVGGKHGFEPFAGAPAWATYGVVPRGWLRRLAGGAGAAAGGGCSPDR